MISELVRSSAMIRPLPPAPAPPFPPAPPPLASRISFSLVATSPADA